MKSRHRSKQTTRIVAGLLALIWLGAGLAALAMAAVAQRWLFALAGVGALWHGVLWVRVVREGRQLTSRKALMPWRLRRPPDP